MNEGKMYVYNVQDTLQMRARRAKGQCTRCGAKGVKDGGWCEHCKAKERTPVSLTYKGKGGLLSLNVRHVSGVKGGEA